VGRAGHNREPFYFRELENEVDNFVVKCVQQGLMNIELWREVRRAMNETDPIGAGR
jgi:hypothetical protein